MALSTNRNKSNTGIFSVKIINLCVEVPWTATELQSSPEWRHRSWIYRGGGGAECTSSAVLLDKLIVPHLFIILTTVRRSQRFIFLSRPVSTWALSQIQSTSLSDLHLACIMACSCYKIRQCDLVVLVALAFPETAPCAVSCKIQLCSVSENRTCCW